MSRPITACEIRRRGLQDDRRLGTLRGGHLAGDQHTGLKLRSPRFDERLLRKGPDRPLLHRLPAPQPSGWVLILGILAAAAVFILTARDEVLPDGPRGVRVSLHRAFVPRGAELLYDVCQRHLQTDGASTRRAGTSRRC